ncbi:DUF4845 domain-containing protein [uncultured Deefgea sp.]|uniref:DUF4845 domain-containing protein n=1 Tax=uncultured Deefgea sp. TaxID=1304914 RepID=UPI00261E375E|nr:DUF4845 domain-containing protein [uncultured Deefgea sp.]
MKKQLGMSFFGFIIVAMAVAMALIVGFKVVPTYTQFFSIQNTVQKLAKNSAGQSPDAIRESFDKDATIGYITDVTGKDLSITQVGGVTTIAANYEKVVPLVANVSLLFDFQIEQSSGTSAQ